jgi:hypothetical protein
MICLLEVVLFEHVVPPSVFGRCLLFHFSFLLLNGLCTSCAILSVDQIKKEVAVGLHVFEKRH